MSVASASKIMDRKVFAASQFIFKQGDEGDRAYFLQKGEVEIIQHREGFPDRILGVIGEGGIFGEMALVDDQPRMASARATRPTTVIVIGREAFKAKLARTDPFIRGLLNIFVKNVRQLSNS